MLFLGYKTVECVHGAAVFSAYKGENAIYCGFTAGHSGFVCCEEQAGKLLCGGGCDVAVAIQFVTVQRDNPDAGAFLVSQILMAMDYRMVRFAEQLKKYLE